MKWQFHFNYSQFVSVGRELENIIYKRGALQKSMGTNAGVKEQGINDRYIGLFISTKENERKDVNFPV